MIMNLPQSSSLKQGKSVGPQVYKILRDQIIRGHFAPGKRISESEISRQLNVSRQPVREAFIKLRNDGLVEVRPQRGTFVTKIYLDAVNDARFIREAIEVEIVKLLVQLADPEHIRLLRELIELQKKSCGADPDEFYQLDEQFHRMLADLAGKSTVWNVVARLKAHFDRVRYLSSSQKPLQRLIDQHENLLDAIARKDLKKAENAIRCHMKEVLIDLPKVVAKQPELFAEQGTTPQS